VTAQEDEARRHDVGVDPEVGDDAHGQEVREPPCLALVAAFAVSVTVSPAVAAPHCEKPCKAETTACIRTRCAGLMAKERRECVERCRGLGGCAAIRTLAYIWNECRSDAGGFTVRRELRIRRGNCAPVTVMTLESREPVPDPLRSCELYGAFRQGWVGT
jgi:hypothetical protein